MIRRTIQGRRSERKRRAGFGLIALVVLICAGIVGTRVWLDHTRLRLDPDSLCPANGPRGLTVILVDRTESLNAIQTAALLQRLLAVKDSLPPQNAIEVYSIAPMTDVLLAPLGARVCSLDRAVSPLTANPKHIQDLWNKKFSAPLEHVFQELLVPRNEPTSPILESLQSISVTAFGRVDQNAKRRLIVASDMLQNTPEFSQYREEPSFTEFQTTQYYHKVRAFLPGVEVELLYVRRDSPVQGKKHVEFWQAYFADCGATLIGVIALPG